MNNIFFLSGSFSHSYNVLSELGGRLRYLSLSLYFSMSLKHLINRKMTGRRLSISKLQFGIYKWPQIPSCLILHNREGLKIMCKLNPVCPPSTS